jgi:diguanylate cyclase (GGDEF)-like protein/PAS domain S-box-containing protein
MTVDRTDPVSLQQHLCNYAETWLWVDVNAQGELTSTQTISPPDAIKSIDEVLVSLQESDAWRQSVGQVGPMENLPDWTWRARWLSADKLNASLGPSLAAALPQTGSDRRLLHVSIYPHMSADYIDWLDSLAAYVIGRDADQVIVFRNRAVQALNNPALIDRLNQDLPARCADGVPEDQVSISDQGLIRHFQRLLIGAPPSLGIEDFLVLYELTAPKALGHATDDYGRLIQLLVEATHDLIVIKDPAGRWLFANAAIIKSLELEGVVWLGKTDRELVDLAHPLVRKALQFCHETDMAAWRKRQKIRHLETIPCEDGRSLIVDVIKQPVYDDEGHPHAIIVVGRDVTELHTTQEQFQILASQDELTGLLNRRFFQVEAQRWIDALGEDAGQHLALLVFDLDYFRSINDSYGHERGDQLLQEMARRLQVECDVRPMLIARMGGDEFAIMVETDNTPESLNALGERVKSLTARPFEIEHLTLFTTTSTGIVVWPEHGRSIGELLHQADSAMYTAKEQGRNGHAVFSPEIMEHQNRLSVLLTALRQSQVEARYSLVYQVQQNGSSLAITGVEALLRWAAPTPDLAVGPDQFIPLLEKSGLIIDVGGWVLEEACQQIARWREHIGERITVAVNVSSVQLHSPCFIGRVRAALERSGIPPSLLELELTETALVNDPAKASSTLTELKKLGVQLALDDFGTGYSSLSYLTQFEFNRLKIDQSFVRDILIDAKDLVIVKAIVAMGHALELEVVAEGVETMAERDLLDSLGCDSFQGYLIGRPGRPEEISPMLGVGLL